MLTYADIIELRSEATRTHQRTHEGETSPGHVMLKPEVLLELLAAWETAREPAEEEDE